MMGNMHQTDTLDAQGLATLLTLGKLPSVWIPPADVRDERELPRTRMTFAQHRTRVKNRLRSTLAKYAISLVTASAGRAHHGRMIKPCNTYPKWAFIEAANVIVAHRHHSSWRGKYVVQLYECTRQRKGHSVAVGALARYLAESTYWVLKKSEPYREPPPWAPGGKKFPVSLSQGEARA